MRAIEGLGLDVQQAVASCFNGFSLDIFKAEVNVMSCYFVATWKKNLLTRREGLLVFAQCWQLCKDGPALLLLPEEEIKSVLLQSAGLHGVAPWRRTAGLRAHPAAKEENKKGTM
jgi:hypothetical protein